MGRWGKTGPILEISKLSLIHGIFRTSFNILLRVGMQTLSAKGEYWTVANVLGIIRVFSEISKRPILGAGRTCLGQDEHD